MADLHRQIHRRPVTGALWRVDQTSGQLITRSQTVFGWRFADAIIGRCSWAEVLRVRARDVESGPCCQKSDGAPRDRVSAVCDTSGVGVPELPSGTVTFLFTDVEGSTRLWDRQTAEMGRALRRHDEILRAHIETHNGFVFTTAGDSFCAAFGTARDALSAASAAQHDLAAEVWPDETPIRVRMGLHTGTAEIRGDDYFGPDVIRAARVEAAGHGGQILVSSVTAGLLRDERLYSVGRHRLSGFDDAIELFQFGER